MISFDLVPPEISILAVPQLTAETPLIVPCRLNGSGLGIEAVRRSTIRTSHYILMSLPVHTKNVPNNRAIGLMCLKYLMIGNLSSLSAAFGG